MLQLLSGFSPAFEASLKSIGIVALGLFLDSFAGPFVDAITSALTSGAIDLGQYQAIATAVWIGVAGQLHAWILKSKTPAPAAAEFEPPSLEVGGRD